MRWVSHSSGIYRFAMLQAGANWFEAELVQARPSWITRLWARLGRS
jgi:hypothetical protein